jgi:hypothetical protein
MKPSIDTTLILHGPLTIYTLFSIKQHCDKYNIVVVSPMPKIKNNIAKEIENVASQSNTNISIFLYGDILKEEYNNQQNRYYHFYSTEMGLRISTTEYSIKMRSDEFYSDLQEFEATVKRNPDKIVTNDVFFRNHNVPIHPCDHLMGGTTKNMFSIFQYARRMAEVPESSIKDEFFPILRETHIFKTHKFIPVEQYIGVATLRTMIEDLDDVTLFSEYMKDVFYIVPSNKLGAFRVAYNSHHENGRPAPKEYLDSSYFDSNEDVQDIELYDSLILTK